jgi:acetyl esterase/lipase
MKYLITYRNGSEFAFIGHSTGCQDAVYFLQHAEEDLQSNVRFVALQAPVSDREDAAMHEGYAENLEYAQNLVNDGKCQEMLPRSYFWAPITAQRFCDLQLKGGTDDYFSSDYTDKELISRLDHVGKHDNLRVLVAFSGADEYVPSHVDTIALTDRLVSAMNTHCNNANDKVVAEGLHLKTGNHNLSEGEIDSKVFIDRVGEILGSII